MLSAGTAELSPEAPFIAVDWGPLTRRAYLLRQDTHVAASHLGAGANALASECYSAEIAQIRRELGDYPVLCAGMVGSRTGWQEVPYCLLPGTVGSLAGQTVSVEADVWIVPGIARPYGRADVMRGEEVDFLGASLSGLVPARAALCQPGPHSKWAHVCDGQIIEFRTAMTGELFALLRDHSMLAPQLREPVTPGASFAKGVNLGRAMDFASELFRIRASGLLHDLPDEDASALVSGMLIGAEVATRVRTIAEPVIHVIERGNLGPLYAEAIRLTGREVTLIPSRDAFCAGARAIWRHLWAP